MWHRHPNPAGIGTNQLPPADTTTPGFFNMPGNNPLFNLSNQAAKHKR
jgi:hypothetical protein